MLPTLGLPISIEKLAELPTLRLPISNSSLTDIYRETGAAACTSFTDIYLETGGAACTSVTDIYPETGGAACTSVTDIYLETGGAAYGSYQAFTVVEGYFHACASGASPISRNWRSCLHVVAATLLLKKLAERAASVSSCTDLLVQQAQ